MILFFQVKQELLDSINTVLILWLPSHPKWLVQSSSRIIRVKYFLYNCNSAHSMEIYHLEKRNRKYNAIPKSIYNTIEWLLFSVFQC